MRRHEIPDADGARVQPLLPARPGPAALDRLFLNAVLWVGKTGAPWRDLPDRFGPWNSVWRRFDRWAQRGVWAALFAALQDPDLEWLILDSTVIRAHPCAAGAKKSGPHRRAGEPGPRAEPGRVRIHAVVSGLGRPVRLTLSPGPDADMSHAEERLDGLTPVVVIGDKGYDKPALVDALEAAGAEAVIPTLKTRTVQRDIDTERYKDRNVVERFWAKIKHDRRVATRYEKTAQNFLAFVHVASIMILLR